MKLYCISLPSLCDASPGWPSKGSVSSSSLSWWGVSWGIPVADDIEEVVEVEETVEEEEKEEVVVEVSDRFCLVCWYV